MIDRHASRDTIIARAKEAFAGYRPTVAALHQHILCTPHDDPQISRCLGTFVSVGYERTGVAEIRYDLHTPNLHYLGIYIKDKHLIIEGTVGNYAGMFMSGRLTNNGVMGGFAGEQMIGTFTNNGMLEAAAGYGMYGVFIDNAPIQNTETLYVEHRIFAGYNVERKNLPAHRQEEFLRLIENPEALPWWELKSQLEKVVG
jgi:hypothetical protein